MSEEPLTEEERALAEVIFAILGAKDEQDFEARTVAQKPSAEPILQFYAAGPDVIFGYDSVPPGDPSRRVYWVTSKEGAKLAYPLGWGTAKSRALRVAADALAELANEEK